jgi:membrane-associated phospholipid phosphatase
MLYAAGWICLPRVFLGEHYVSDVVVGAGIGIALVVRFIEVWVAIPFRK